MQKSATVCTFVLMLGCGRIGYEFVQDGAEQPLLDAGTISEIDAASPDAGTFMDPPDGGTPIDASGGVESDAGVDASSTPLDAGVDASSTPLDAGADAWIPPSDAGAILSPPPDAGPPLTGECAVTYADALVCSGFEDAPGDVWTRATSNGSAATQTVRVRSGARALRASTNLGGGFAYMYRAFPAQDVEFWGRLYLYVPSTVVIDDVNYLGFDHGGSAVYGLDFSLNANGTYEVYSAESGAYGGPPLAWVPRDRWVCVQWHVRVGDIGGQVELHVDGTRQINAMPIDTRPGGALDSVNVGLDWSSTDQGAIELFVDDLVIDTAPVPCD